jgi:RNA polymerase subunit RPABC4/transcription elongation factor Spt4
MTDTPAKKTFDCDQCPLVYQSKQALKKHKTSKHLASGTQAISTTPTPQNGEMLERIASLERVIREMGDTLSFVVAQTSELQERCVMLSKGAVKSCVVCYSKENTHAFMPCGHKATCGDCSELIRQKKGVCPYCDVPIASTKRIFDQFNCDVDDNE